MTFKRGGVGEVQVFTPRHKLVCGPETLELVAATNSIAAQGTARIVNDLSHVDFVSSLALGALVKIHVSCCNRGGWLRIAGVGVRIKNVLVTTRLIFLFDTFDTVEAALSGAGSQRPSTHYPATRGIAQPPSTPGQSTASDAAGVSAAASGTPTQKLGAVGGG